MGDGWTDSGRVFTKEDGTPLWDGWSTRSAPLAKAAGLPPVRFHDLQHGALSMALAAGVDLKVVSAIAGTLRQLSPRTSTSPLWTRWPRPQRRRSTRSLPAATRLESAMSQQETPNDH